MRPIKIQFTKTSIRRKFDLIKDESIEIDHSILVSIKDRKPSAGEGAIRAGLSNTALILENKLPSISKSFLENLQEIQER